MQSKNTESSPILKVTLDDILKRKQGDAKKAKELRDEKSRQEFFSQKDSTVIQPLLPDNDVPHYIKFLHSFDKSLALNIHQFRGDSWCNAICEEHYGKECSICKMESRFGKCYAKSVRCFVGFVFDKVGKTFTGKDGTVKPETPIKIIHVPQGIGGNTEITLKNADKFGNFQNVIWVLSKKHVDGAKGRRVQIVEMLTEDEYLDRLGAEATSQVSDLAKVVQGLDKNQIASLILNSFGNVDLDALGVSDLPKVNLYNMSQSTSSSKADLEQ